uniref:Uncharacterized protein n=1 Tax=Rhizophora mucronata TaxID=61149 RepID=A0A2P2PFH8_RHIMU
MLIDIFHQNCIFC